MQQTKFQSSVGTVKIHSATMLRTSGYGQYSIQIDAEYRGKRKLIKEHSTGAHLFDYLQSMDNEEYRVAHLLGTYIAEKMIEDWVAEIPDVDEETVSDEILQYFTNEIYGVDRFIANTGIDSEKREQVLAIMRDADKKWRNADRNAQGETPEQSKAIDDLIEETAKKLAAL